MADQTLTPQMAEWMKREERRSARASEMMAADPNLDMMSAIIMAGDEDQAYLAEERIAGGTPVAQACWMVGSYARAGWLVRQLELERTTLDEVLAIWPEVWRGSDPDDTDPRFLRLWKQARERAGVVITDDPNHRLTKARTTVFRGQRPGQPFGIAWTTDLDIAKKFGTTFGLRGGHQPGGVVYEAVIEKGKALAYLTGRNESEVVLDPADIDPRPLLFSGVGL